MRYQKVGKMFDRKITRDRLGRVVTLLSRRYGPGASPIVHVLEYDGATRKPLLIRLTGARVLKRLPNDTIEVTTDSGMTAPKASWVSNVLLNQRTGRLSWVDSQHGLQVADLPPGRSSQDKGVEALIIFALLLFPPTTLIAIYLMLRWAIKDQHEANMRRLNGILDAVWRAYDES